MSPDMLLMLLGMVAVALVAFATPAADNRPHGECAGCGLPVHADDSAWYASQPVTLTNGQVVAKPVYQCAAGGGHSV